MIFDLSGGPGQLPTMLDALFLWLSLLTGCVLYLIVARVLDARDRSADLRRRVVEWDVRGRQEVFRHRDLRRYLR